MNARNVLFAALGGLAVTVMLASASPARAHDDDWRWRRHEWREHEWREHEWREHHRYRDYRPYVYAPPPAYYRYGW